MCWAGPKNCLLVLHEAERRPVPHTGSPSGSQHGQAFSRDPLVPRTKTFFKNQTAEHLFGKLKLAGELIEPNPLF